MSTGAGYVLYRDTCCSGFVSSVVPMIELHYTTDLATSGGLATPIGDLTSRSNNIDVLNLTVGANFELGPRANLNVAFGVPLTGSGDRQFDWQALAQLNIAFGGCR